jgi:hypothetical protein
MFGHQQRAVLCANTDSRTVQHYVTPPAGRLYSPQSLFLQSGCRSFQTRSLQFPYLTSRDVRLQPDVKVSQCRPLGQTAVRQWRQVVSEKKLVLTHRSVRRYNPDDKLRNLHRRENLRRHTSLRISRASSVFSRHAHTFFTYLPKLA